jgi:beta-lactamase superfamily II metal-dependent hydrolase
MLKETTFMMSFVFITKDNNCIVVDGGRKEDMPTLKQYVGGRHISAWILTHAHNDHISGLIHEIEKNGAADFDIEKIYYNFPDYDRLMQVRDVPDLTYFQTELDEALLPFNKVKDKIADKLHIVKQGDTLEIDELEIEFLFSLHDGLYSNLMNDASLVFKVKAPRKTILFLGDLGPEGGDWLYRESRNKLKADIVQMAHHGHMNVSMEVYAAIAPSVCLWCAPQWLYDEPEVPAWMTERWFEIDEKRIRMYGTAVTRKWMEILGVKEHYVSAHGTVELEV